MDASAFERYNRENQEIIELALKVNSKAGKASDKAVWVRSKLRPDTLSIDATLIEFREWLTTLGPTYKTTTSMDSKPSTKNCSMRS